MMKRTLAVLFLIGMGLSTASSETEYFIQVNAIPTQPVYVDEADSPGGIEVYNKDGTFISCAIAFTIETWNGDKLAPLSYGFMSRYPLKELNIKPRGALSRVKIETKETKTE